MPKPLGNKTKTSSPIKALSAVLFVLLMHKYHSVPVKIPLLQQPRFCESLAGSRWLLFVLSSSVNFKGCSELLFLAFCRN